MQTYEEYKEEIIFDEEKLLETLVNEDIKSISR